MAGDQLRLAFVGDLSLTFLRADVPSEFPGWRALMANVGAHDALIGNLECCLVDERCNANARRERMAVSTDVAPLLERAGFSALCLANNHMLDCGAQAIAVTREKLEAEGIDGFGAGMNRAEAEQPLFIERAGRRIALLGACDSEYAYADTRRAGVAPLKRRALGQRVRAAAAHADLVVVTLHADLEFCPVPAPWRRRLSRWLIEQGAHLIIQHHPHVLQGVETYGNGLIAYSLGNCIFRLCGNAYQESRPSVFDSMVLVVEVVFSSAARPELSYRVVPARIAEDHFPRLLEVGNDEDALREVERCSALIGSRREYRRAWFQRCRAEGHFRMRSIYYALARGHFSQATAEIRQLVGRGEDRRWIVGLLSFGYV